MNLPTIIILLLVAVAMGLAIRSIIRSHKKGGCSGCSGGCCCQDKDHHCH